MEYFIYITTNLITGDQYIGQHKGNRNDSYLGSGVILVKAIKKYGKENFKRDILCFCSDQNELDQKEKEYIAFYNAVNDPNFYNLSAGGQKGDGWGACQKWRQTHPDEAFKLDQQAAKNLKQWTKEHPEEVAANIQKCIEGSKKYWKTHPKEMLAHMAAVNRAKEKWQEIHKEEHLAQVEEWRKKGTETNSKPIVCLTTGEVFPSMSEAGRQYNVPQANISKCIRGERKSAGKHPLTKKKLLWALISKEEYEEKKAKKN